MTATRLFDCYRSACRICNKFLLRMCFIIVTAFFFCSISCSAVEPSNVLINPTVDLLSRQEVVTLLVEEETHTNDHHLYSEYIGLDDFPYYPEEEFRSDTSNENRNGNDNVELRGMPAVLNKMKQQGIEVGHFIMNDFVVGGVNLASFQMKHPPFLLYEDFDIILYIEEEERKKGKDDTRQLSWKDLLLIRNKLQRPSLSWYVDKVARKRWIAEQDVYPQPRIYFLRYKDELTEKGEKFDEATAILSNLPTEIGFCAKPTHMSMTMGNWLVDIDPNVTKQDRNHGDVDSDDDSSEEEGDKVVKFTKRAQRLNSDERYDPRVCADSLAEGLHREATGIESWALKMVRPGIVIEELFAHHGDRSLPPHEFCMFVVWGRVVIGQWNEVDDERYSAGFFYRDGSAAPGNPINVLDDWIPWMELVHIAEELSQHKDMFRIDMFVGVPRYSEDGTEPRIVVSESEIHPTTMFSNPFIAEEMARLWIAGYKIGNYKLIPNNEVPPGYFVKKADELLHTTNTTKYT